MATTNEQRSSNKTIALWAGLIIIFVAFFKWGARHPPRGDLAPLEKQATAGTLAAVVVERDGDAAAVRGRSTSGEEFTLDDLAFDRLLVMLNEHHVGFTLLEKPSGWNRAFDAVMYWGPLLFISAITWWLSSKHRSAMPNREELTNARIRPEPVPPARPVEGLDEAKDALVAALAAARDGAVGKAGPTRIMLEGPSGAGKSALLHWLAAQGGTRAMFLPGHDAYAMYSGLASARIQRFFDVAQSAAPCLAVLDNIDAFALRRVVPDSNDGSQQQFVNSESTNALLELCRVLDAGLAPGVLFVATTNRADRLDEALRRKGRFDLWLRLDSSGAVEMVELPAIPVSA